jgi:hypothetical protein
VAHFAWLSDLPVGIAIALIYYSCMSSVMQHMETILPYWTLSLDQKIRFIHHAFNILIIPCESLYLKHEYIGGHCNMLTPQKRHDNIWKSYPKARTAFSLHPMQQWRYTLMFCRLCPVLFDGHWFYWKGVAVRVIHYIFFPFDVIKDLIKT